jgi:hypothetical protein
MVGAASESACDLRRRGACTTSRQFVDCAIESAVPKRRSLERPEAIGEDADEVCANGLDVPAGTQTRGSQCIVVKAVEEVGDSTALCGHGLEYLYAFHAPRCG